MCNDIQIRMIRIAVKAEAWIGIENQKQKERENRWIVSIDKDILIRGLICRFDFVEAELRRISKLLFLFNSTVDELLNALPDSSSASAVVVLLLVTNYFLSQNPNQNVADAILLERISVSEMLLACEHMQNPLRLTVLSLAKLYAFRFCYFNDLNWQTHHVSWPQVTIKISENDERRRLYRFNTPKMFIVLDEHERSLALHTGATSGRGRSSVSFLLVQILIVVDSVFCCCFS